MDRKNNVFAIGALMFAKEDKCMIMKCLIINKWMVKLWSGRGEKLVSENRMANEPKKVATVIILRIIYHR
jgi:N-acetylglutamate synthase-like GNAT family acetyltransferase